MNTSDHEWYRASEVTSKNVSNVQRRKCFQTGNDPKTGNYPQTESDHQNGNDPQWTANDPRCGPQMILPESGEWHEVWFPGFFNFWIRLDLVKHLIIKRSEKVLHNVSMTPCHHFQVNRIKIKERPRSGNDRRPHQCLFRFKEVKRKTGLSEVWNVIHKQEKAMLELTIRLHTSKAI